MIWRDYGFELLIRTHCYKGTRVEVWMPREIDGAVGEAEGRETESGPLGSGG